MRMLGTYANGQCPACRRSPGPDCPTTGRSKKAQRAHERRQWQREFKADPDG